jgi:hypothetical protein
MSILHELVIYKQNLKTSEPIRKKSKPEAVEVFNSLTLKEKCLYLVKISKKNTSFQALVLMGLTLLIITADYLFL